MFDFAEATKDMTAAETLNYYRNLYYAEPQVTERGIVANAINDYFKEVAPMAEVEKMQECIYDLYVMLDRVIESAKKHDLTMLRPRRGACACDAYQGSPLICRSFDELLDKHIETIHGAAKSAELKKKYTEDKP